MQVSKPQMNKIAIIERKILRASSGLYRRPNSVKYFTNEKIYNECDLNPIEKQLLTHTLNFFEKLNINREFWWYLKYEDEEMEKLHYYNSKPPAYILYLNESDKLFDNDNEIYFNNLPSLYQYRHTVV